jgi:hypothetical protein
MSNKPKKKRIVTTETIEEPEAVESQPAPLPSETTEIDGSIEEMLGRLDLGNEGTVCVYRYVKHGAKEYCARVPPADLDEDFIREQFGGGKYFLRVVDGRGRYVRSFSLSIAQERTQTAPAPVPAAAANGGASDVQIQLLREQLARQHEMLLRLMEGNAKPPAAVNDIVEGIARIHALTPKQESALGLSDLMAAFRQGIEIAREVGTGGDEKMGWVHLIERVLEKAPALVGGIASAARPELNLSQAPAAPSPKENGHMLLLRSVLPFLKQKCLRQSDPGLYVDFVMDGNLDGPQLAALYKLLAEPYEQLGEIDPELLTEPYRAWFLKLFDGLRDALQSSDDSGERRRDADNAP